MTRLLLLKGIRVLRAVDLDTRQQAVEYAKSWMNGARCSAAMNLMGTPRTLIAGDPIPSDFPPELVESILATLDDDA